MRGDNTVRIVSCSNQTAVILCGAKKYLASAHFLLFTKTKKKERNRKLKVMQCNEIEDQNSLLRIRLLSWTTFITLRNR